MSSTVKADPTAPSGGKSKKSKKKKAATDSVNGTEKDDATQDPADSIEEQKDVEESSLQTRIDELEREKEELAKKLSTLQVDDGDGLREKLKETEEERDKADANYRSLLGKVSNIKATLGERLKADAEELAETRKQLEELEEQNRVLRENNDSLQSTISKLASQDDNKDKELLELRSRSTLSQQNWSKERDDLRRSETALKEEYEATKQAMQDWEVLAMEERAIREGLSEKVGDLEEQYATVKEQYERTLSERNTQAEAVDGLQRALSDIQDARKRELRELAETSQAQLSALQKSLEDQTHIAETSASELASAKTELERLSPFEKEVREKNLLIGKLRHEAVILNDHLTKALRFLKKGRPEDNVDRRIVTNHFLQFLALDRSDPKKFQILQLIAALLNWDDDQREQAGLSRPGGALAPSGFSLLRKASNSNLAKASSPDIQSPSRESLAELWSNFLEQEAAGKKESN